MEAVPKFLSKDDCLKVLSRKTAHPVQVIDFEIVKFSEQTMGFLGDHFRLVIEYLENGHARKTSFFVKTLPQFNQNQNDYVKAMGVFRKESLVYQNLLADMSKLSSLPFAPRCYHIRPFDCIVLEDLGGKGFKICNGPYMDFNHCAALMRTLARFHAASLAFEERKSLRIGDEFREEVREGSFSFTEGHPRYDWCCTVTKCVVDLIRLSGTKRYEEIGKKFYGYVFGSLPALLEPSKKFRNVLTHDDPWNNNILFGPDLECVLVDYQLVRYAPPGFDFLVALFLNFEDKTDLEVFVEIYFDSLSGELTRHQLDAAKVLPKDEFLASLEAYRVPALVECVMYGTNVFISKELANTVVASIETFKEFAFVDRSKYICKEYEENTAFRNRFDNVLLPLVEALAD